MINARQRRAAERQHAPVRRRDRRGPTTRPAALQTRASATRAGGAAATSTTLGYAGAGERVKAADWAAAGAGDAELDYNYDGGLPLTIAASAGTVAFTPAAAGLRPTSLRSPRARARPSTYALERNADLLPTRQGAFTIGRDAATGRRTDLHGGRHGRRAQRHDGLRPGDQRALPKGADSAYTLAVERDAAGRVVTARTETVAGGAAIVRAYAYDAQGRLTRVDDGAGAALETYAYDADGNRTSAGGERRDLRRARRADGAGRRARSPSAPTGT